MIRRHVGVSVFEVDAAPFLLAGLLVLAWQATGRARTTVGLEAYNALNSSVVLTYSNTYAPQGRWLQPLSIMTPRYLKLTGEIDF